MGTKIWIFRVCFRACFLTAFFTYSFPPSLSYPFSPLRLPLCRLCLTPGKLWFKCPCDLGTSSLVSCWDMASPSATNFRFLEIWIWCDMGTGLSLLVSLASNPATLAGLLGLCASLVTLNNRCIMTRAGVSKYRASHPSSPLALDCKTLPCTFSVPSPWNIKKTSRLASLGRI